MADPVAQVLNSNDGSGAPLTRQYLSAMTLLGIADTSRAKMLSAQQAFADCTQHDHFNMSWDGARRDPGVGYFLERLAPQGFTAINTPDIPAGSRKPDAPASLARQVVSRFTEMWMGGGRRPQIVVDSDEDTQAYLEAVFQAAKTWDTLGQARDISGACGSALIACGVMDGKPTTEALNPKDCWVAEWETSPHWRPRVVVEQALVESEVIDSETGKLTETLVWRTRAWTPEHVLHYPEVSQDDAIDPEFVWPAPHESPHPLGMCPVVWLQNTRNTKCQDGLPDCHGAWELLDKIDRLQSQACKATFANVDPTLVIKEDERYRKKSLIVRKGKAIGVSTAGDARYLEMEGTSIKVAHETIRELTEQVLQTVECVIIRQEQAGTYQSGEALQILWRSMESKANRLRTTLNQAIQDLAEIWLKWGAEEGVANVEAVGREDDKSGLLLPPRKTTTNMFAKEDADGMPTDDLTEKPEGHDEDLELDKAPPVNHKVTWTTHEVGKGNYVTLDWPPYWNPTPVQTQTILAALAAATGGKQVISTETAIRHGSQYLGADPEAEMRNIEREKAKMRQERKIEMREMEEMSFDEEDAEGSAPPGGPLGSSKPPKPKGPRNDDKASSKKPAGAEGAKDAVRKGNAGAKGVKRP